MSQVASLQRVHAMSQSRPARTILDVEYLPIRAKLLEIAAALDRIDRGENPATHDPREEQLRRGIQLLLGEGPDRARQVQRLFSLPYDEQWRETFGLNARS